MGGAIWRRTFARTFVVFIRIMLASLALGSIEKAEGKQLALLIGNNEYESQPKLVKAVGDAWAMGTTLQALGFQVTVKVNLTYAGMADTLAKFQSAIEPGDKVAFHFSGHGVAAEGHNYLLPVDFPLPNSGREAEALLPHLAFDAADVVSNLRAQGAALTLAIFDACRDNALTSGTRSILSRGLVRMDPPSGVFVMFSAGPGELAADRLSNDDPAPTSVFTRVFIPNLETPGLTLVQIAKRTQIDVSELAATIGHQQFPDYSDRVRGDIVLNPASIDLPVFEGEPPPAPPNPEVGSPDGRWSAMAYENYTISPGTNFGFAQDKSNKDEAVNFAIEECENESREKGRGLSCVVTARSEEAYEEPVFREGCLSVFSNAGGTWRFAKAATEIEARQRARAACVAANDREYMGDPCKNVRSVCSP